jgi:hypothetical protein
MSVSVVMFKALRQADGSETFLLSCRMGMGRCKGASSQESNKEDRAVHSGINLAAKISR